MEEERDSVVFEDEEGNKLELDVLEYFEHEGEEYAILVDMEGAGDEESEQEAYIMKIVVNGDEEEFLPPDEEKMDELISIAEQIISEGCDCEDDCGEDCGCGCHDKD